MMKTEQHTTSKGSRSQNTRTGVSGHTMDCLGKGDASECPKCKPINDSATARLDEKGRPISNPYYIGDFVSTIAESFAAEATDKIMKRLTTSDDEEWHIFNHIILEAIAKTKKMEAAQ